MLIYLCSFKFTDSICFHYYFEYDTKKIYLFHNTDQIAVRAYYTDSKILDFRYPYIRPHITQRSGCDIKNHLYIKNLTFSGHSILFEYVYDNIFIHKLIDELL